MGSTLFNIFIKTDAHSTIAIKTAKENTSFPIQQYIFFQQKSPSIYTSTLFCTMELRREEEHLRGIDTGTSTYTSEDSFASATRREHRIKISIKIL